jgi:hypothetical protein
MSKHLNFTRRAALAGLAAGGLMAAISARRVQAFTLPERAGDGDLAETALSMFRNPYDVRRVGMAC